MNAEEEDRKRDMYPLIRKDIVEALDGWADGSRPNPGGFVRAVLQNNLCEALQRADPDNRRALQEIVWYVYNELPSPCHGSAEAVAAWRASFPTEVPT